MRRAGLALAASLACGEGERATRSQVAAATAVRCADLSRAATGLDEKVGGARLAGDALVVEAGERAIVGVVADARAGGEATLRQLGAIRRRFVEAEVDLVVSLGGMGGDEASIGGALAALADGQRWPIFALPGDREPVAAHRAAVDRLRAGGTPVVDGSRVRFATIGGATVASLPGAAAPARLRDPAGCLRDDADAAALAAALAKRAGGKLIASHAPPRGSGDASDVGAAGVHIGEPGLTAAAAAAGAALVLHGLVDEAALGTRKGERKLDAAPVGLGAGPAEAAAIGALAGDASVTGSALILTLRPREASWERIILLAGERAR